MMEKAEDKPLEIHYFIVICKECGKKRTIKFDSPIHGAKELIWWFENRLEPCGPPCKGTHCDIAVPMDGTKEPPP